MDNVFDQEKWKFVIPYLDDIIIFSKSKEEHQKHIERGMTRTRAVGLKLNPSKYKFYREEVEILGNIVTKGKFKPAQRKQKQ